MKYVLLAAAAALTLSIPAHSQNQTGETDQIVIQGIHSPSIDRWGEGLSHKLSDSLAYPRAFRTTGIAEGTVAIQFSCGEDGKPVAVRLLRSSGERALDLAALKAVNRINGLHPLPARLDSGATVRANLIFAVDQSSLDRQLTALRKHEARLVAEERRTGQQVVVIGARTAARG